MQLVTTLVGVVQLVVPAPLVVSLTPREVVTEFQSSQPPLTVVHTAVGVDTVVEQVVPYAIPPPTPAAAQEVTGVQVDMTGYGDVSRCHVVQLLEVAQLVENLAVPVVVVVIQPVTVVTGGVEHTVTGVVRGLVVTAGVLGPPGGPQLVHVFVAGDVVVVDLGVPVVMVDVMTEVVVTVLQMGVGVELITVQDEPTAMPPPRAYVAHADTAVHVDLIGYGDVSRCQVVQLLEVEQVEVVMGVPVVVVSLQDVEGTTAGVVHVELVPHETLMTRLALEQTGVGVDLPVEQDEETAIPPAS